jgi:hypothetical protein
MKLIQATIAALAALSIATSCVVDPAPAGGKEGIPVVISFNPVADGREGSRAESNQSTRAGYHGNNDPQLGDPDTNSDSGHAVGSAADSSIEHIRVMLYDGSTGRFVSQYATEVPAGGGSVKIKVLTGVYDVVFVANESSDASGVGDGFLSDFFADAANYDLVGEVSNALVDGSAFANDRAIPMFAVVPGVHIVGERHVVADRDYVDTDVDPWRPCLTRAGVRLSMEITLRPVEFADWVVDGSGATAHRDISIGGVPSGSWLRDFGKTNYSTDGSTVRVYSAVEADLSDPDDPQPRAGADGYWWKREGATDSEDRYVVRFDRLILPELFFADKSNGAKAMEMSMMFGGDKLTGKISGPQPDTSNDGYTLPRNTWLHLDVTVAVRKMDVTPRILPWNIVEQDLGVVNTGYRVLVESPVNFAGEAGSRLATVSTDMSGAADFDILTDGVTTKAFDAAGDPVDWITSVVKSGAVETTILDGKAAITRKLEVTVAANTVGPGIPATRRAYIAVRMGSITRKIEIVQPPQGVYAAPGTIGFIAEGPRAGELTLRGSKHFAGTVVEEASPVGEPVSDQTVYLAWFKWGSLVAMDSRPGAGIAFDSSFLIAAPAGYGGSTSEYEALVAARAAYDDPALTTDAERWAAIAHAGSFGWSRGRDILTATAANDVSRGLGDPCAHYFGRPWRLPLGGDNTYNGGWNGGSFTSTTMQSTPTSGTYMTGWYGATNRLSNGARYIPAGQVQDGDTVAIPVNGAVGGSAGEPDWSLFLTFDPYTRNGSGALARPGLVTYWSSTAGTTGYGYGLSFNASNAAPGRIMEGGAVAAVRCVKPATRLDVTPGSLHWASDGQPGEQTLTVLSDGPWTLTLSGTNSSAFVIDMAGATLTGENSVKGAGNRTLTVKTMGINYDMVSKKIATITVSSPGLESKTVELVQERLTKNFPYGPHAAPGVIGYTVDRRLTLRGSSAFAGTMVDPAVSGDNGIGALEDEEVYVALFKWGSLVALSSDMTDAQADGNNWFDADDIISVPAEYNGAGSPDAARAQLQTAIGNKVNNEAWGSPVGYTFEYANIIPYRDYVVSPFSAPDWNLDAAAGLGDPCAYYFGGSYGGDWHLPTGNPWYAEGGRPFTGYQTAPLNGDPWTLDGGTGAGASWIDRYAITPELPVAGAVAGDGEGNRVWSMFLGATGTRAYDSGALDNTSDAVYWSGTPGGNNGYEMVLNRQTNGTNYRAGYSTASAIRCVH